MSTEVATENAVEHPTEHLTQDLATAVEGALWSYDPIRQTRSLVSTTVDDGVATLSGVVRTVATRRVAGLLASGVPGVTAVNNVLVTDTDIESAVALALAKDPEVAMLTDRVSVKSLLGTVYLGGVVVTPELATAEAAVTRAESLTREVDGVHDVLNRVRAVEGAEKAAMTSDGDASELELELEAGAGGPSAEEEAMQERLAVWRERATAKGS